MSLSAALSTAKNSLKTSSGQLNITSQNIAGANDVNYVRRSTYVQSGAHGAVYATVVRESDPHLLANYLNKNSQSFASSSYANSIDRLYEIYGADDYSNSPAALLKDFQEALQNYANSPTQTTLGDTAVYAAKDLVTSFNEGYKQIAQLRNEADEDIQKSVDKINSLLKQFQEVDRAVYDETAAGRDPYAYMDERDKILKELSTEIGITTVNNQDGTTTIYGLDGSTLYDKTPRLVTFTKSSDLVAGATGNQVYIDGVPLSHDSFVDPYGSGTIGGLLQFRDKTSVQYQKQLDETAKAVYDMFAGVKLFTLTNGTADEATGISGRIQLNTALFDSNSGGSPTNFGATGADIQKLVDAFEKNRDYGTGTGLSNGQSILSFASNSTAWLDGVRSNATSDNTYRITMTNRAMEALSNATGVNTDDEMALLLQLEQSYAASSRIMTTVAKMLDDLMAAI